jgi:preprotein translocase subunit SecD
MPNFGKWKIILILAVSLMISLYAVPNLLNESQRDWLAQNMPGWMPHRAMSLGLDLQGGSHLQLQVDMDTVVADRMDSMVLAARTTLKEKSIGVDRAGVKNGNHVVVLLKDVSDAEDAETALERDLGLGVLVERDGAEITITYTPQELLTFKKQAIAQSIEIIRRRIDETGTKEPIIQAQGDDRILVQLPGMKDPERVKQLLGKTARMTFHLVDVDVTPTACASGQAPLTVRCLSLNDEPGAQLAVKRRALITGDMLVDAQPGYDVGGRSVVNFRFDSLGARKFAEITRANVGNPFAIVLDDMIITAPRINEPIIGGSGQISGNFSVESANDLAILLRAGALPAPLKVVEERTVGPSLGSDSINSGKIASAVATVLVIAFMFIVYGRYFGLFANIALIVNMMMMIGILSMLGATLTLPGIVGIVLTIGMAVDANVLIFERMREEIRAGRNVMPTIDHGFQGAMSSIMDANITSLIAAVVLFAVGTGPVRGFAVTLAVGIVTSLFCAIYLTRLIIVTWVNWRKPKTLPL